MNDKWHLFSLEQPERSGIYEVRLVDKNDLLSCPIETIMEYDRDEWLMRVPDFINEKRVEAWKYR